MSPAFQALLTLAGLAAFIYIIWRDTQRIQQRRNEGPVWRRKW